MKTRHVPPEWIGDVKVERIGDELVVWGQTWVTLASAEEGDERIWEFSLTTGDLIRTR